MNSADLGLLQSCLIGAAFFTVAAFAVWRVVDNTDVRKFVEEDLESQTSETEEVALLDEISGDTIYLPRVYFDRTEGS